MSNVIDMFPWVGESRMEARVRGQFVDAKCPLCHGKNLWFKLGDRGLKFGCWRGCNKLEVLRALGLGWDDTFFDKRIPDNVERKVTAIYRYDDESGKTLYEKLRIEPGFRGRDKAFAYRRPVEGGGFEKGLGDIRRVLYRLPQLIADTNRAVFVVAGEKDADTLARLGFLATTNVSGESEEWVESYSLPLVGRHVIVVEDRDDAGSRHGSMVCGSLLGRASSLRRVRLSAKDSTALINSWRVEGVTDRTELRRRFLDEVRKTPVWRPALA